MIKIMRTIIDIPSEKIQILDTISKKRHISRAQLIRNVIDLYINQLNSNRKSYEKVFAIWKDKKIDSVEYQRKLRDEWER